MAIQLQRLPYDLIKGDTRNTMDEYVFVYFVALHAMYTDVETMHNIYNELAGINRTISQPMGIHFQNIDRSTLLPIHLASREYIGGQEKCTGQFGLRLFR